MDLYDFCHQCVLQLLTTWSRFLEKYSNLEKSLCPKRINVWRKTRGELSNSNPLGVIASFFLNSLEDINKNYV